MKSKNAEIAKDLERGEILVLNATYEPLNITSWKRAYILILKEKAELVSPKVIRLVKYIKVSIQKLLMRRPSKQAIYKRDKNKCQYCGSTSRLTIDHVVPQSRNGGSGWDNLVVACSSCNSAKGDTPLEQTNLRLKKKPSPVTRVGFTIEYSNVTEWKKYVYS
jgi:5-methylcytosine-specific restriction endonuclease McrA